LVPTLGNFVVGIVAGVVVLALVTGVRKLRSLKAEADK
jgi:predicted DNA repair protein MutK